MSRCYNVSKLKTSTCKKDIENLIKAAHGAYGRLCHRIFNNHAITMRTKIIVIQAIVLSTLLYACETWTLYRRDMKRLESFQQRKPRQILANWEDRISNDKILKPVSLPSVEAVLKRRLPSSGHVPPMDFTKLPKIVLYGELDRGNDRRGDPTYVRRTSLSYHSIRQT